MRAGAHLGSDRTIFGCGGRGRVAPDTGTGHTAMAGSRWAVAWAGGPDYPRATLTHHRTTAVPRSLGASTTAQNMSARTRASAPPEWEHFSAGGRPGGHHSPRSGQGCTVADSRQYSRTTRASTIARNGRDAARRRRGARPLAVKLRRLVSFGLHRQDGSWAVTRSGPSGCQRGTALWHHGHLGDRRSSSNAGSSVGHGPRTGQDPTAPPPTLKAPSSTVS